MKSGLVYVDESGNIGLTGKSSDDFVMAAVAINENAAVIINNEISVLCEQFGFSGKSELKFSRTNKDKIKTVLNMLRVQDISIYAVIFSKDSKLSNTSHTIRYNDILLNLLELIKLDIISVKIDGKVGKKYHRNTKTWANNKNVCMLML